MFRTWILACLLALGTIGLVSVPATAGGGGGGGGSNVVRVEGQLIGINVRTRQVVIRRFNGAVVTLTLNAGTKIERNDRHVGLAAFKIGDRAQARLINGAVVKFEAVGR